MSTELIASDHTAPLRKHYPHAVVWLDHFHAVVAFVAPDQHRSIRVDTHRDDTQFRRRSGAPGPGRAPLDTEFFERVADTVERNDSNVLLAGPGTAKHDFRRWLTSHRPALAAKVVALEPLDHPSEGELVAYARRAFRRLDRLGIG